MALTPDDVVHKRFETTRFRDGYDQDEVDDFLDEVVNTLRADAHGIVTALRAGIFPHRPESERYTNVTTVCGHRDVTTLWEKLQDAPELGPHLVLLTQEETR